MSPDQIQNADKIFIELVNNPETRSTPAPLNTKPVRCEEDAGNDSPSNSRNRYGCMVGSEYDQPACQEMET